MSAETLAGVTLEILEDIRNKGEDSPLFNNQIHVEGAYYVARASEDLLHKPVWDDGIVDVNKYNSARVLEEIKRQYPSDETLPSRALTLGIVIAEIVKSSSAEYLKSEVRRNKLAGVNLGSNGLSGDFFISED